MYIVDHIGPNFHNKWYFDKEETAFDCVERLKRNYCGIHTTIRIYTTILEVKTDESER